MTYKLPNNSKVEFISLRVSNLNQMVDFYTKVIGLSIIKRTETEAYLGILSKRRIFIGLHKINSASKNRNVPNMSSFSLISPNQKSFKEILVHIHNLGIRIPKVFSNMFFDKCCLTDPDGNHVNLLVKKFNSQKLNENQTESVLDASYYSDSLKHYLGDFHEKRNALSSNTRLGQIFLNASDLKKSACFYRDSLGLNVHVNKKHQKAYVFSDHKATPLILAHNSNQSLKPRNSKTLGLDYFNIKLSSPDELDQLALHFSKNHVDYIYSQASNFIFISDPNQINITFSLL